MRSSSIPSCGAARSCADAASKLGPGPNRDADQSLWARGYRRDGGNVLQQATDKLSEVFSSLFQVTKPVPRGDLTPTKPVIVERRTNEFQVNGDPHLALIGRNFDKQCNVTVNGKKRDVGWESATRVTVTLLAAEDLKDKGELTLIVQNPSAAGGDPRYLRSPWVQHRQKDGDVCGSGRDSVSQITALSRHLCFQRLRRRRRGPMPIRPRRGRDQRRR